MRDWGGHILIIAFNLVDKPIKCNNQDVTPITPLSRQKKDWLRCKNIGIARLQNIVYKDIE